ncbi:MAG: aminoacyl-tRNA hydrolase [Chloroflexi bacterium RBG_19FT_COMBO_50_10]|nr:MAG: aminoacyl-tRNA hydrolase [Chloroflexi bacterium RBG_19FT_COMBO_50_10]
MIEPIPQIETQPQKRSGPFLIVGLGNPGRKFEHNRHNVGFILLNRLSTKLGEGFGRVEARALVSKPIYQGERVILVKPQTFMNNSGSSVSSLLRFYQVPLENLLVAYDDVDLPLGVVRLRPSGGSAGQKGMQSIIERLGTEEFPRLRIGTGRPPGRQEAADYVLQDFRSQETEPLEDALDRAVEAVLVFIRDGLDRAMNLFNG